MHDVACRRSKPEHLLLSMACLSSHIKPANCLCSHMSFNIQPGRAAHVSLYLCFRVVFRRGCWGSWTGRAPGRPGCTR